MVILFQGMDAAGKDESIQEVLSALDPQVCHAKQFKTPMLLTIGENDFRVPLNQTIENWSVLQRMQVPSRLIVFPEANHWIMKGEDSRYWYSEVHKWLAEWLNK